MQDNKLVEGLDDEYSKQIAEIISCKNPCVLYIQSERLCGELLLKLLMIHGYKKTRSQLAKLGRRLNKLSKGVANV